MNANPSQTPNSKELTPDNPGNRAEKTDPDEEELLPIAEFVQGKIDTVEFTPPPIDEDEVFETDEKTAQEYTIAPSTTKSRPLTEPAHIVQNVKDPAFKWKGPSTPEIQVAHFLPPQIPQIGVRWSSLMHFSHSFPHRAQTPAQTSFTPAFAQPPIRENDYQSLPYQPTQDPNPLIRRRLALGHVISARELRRILTRAQYSTQPVCRIMRWPKR